MTISIPIAWITDAAEALAADLRTKNLARDRRKSARDTLMRAFDAIEQGAGTATLLHQLESFQISPVKAPIRQFPLLKVLKARNWAPPDPGFRWRVSVQIRGAVDRDLVTQWLAHTDLHTEIVERLQRVLDTFQSTPILVGQSKVRPSQLAERDLDFSFPEG